MNRWARDFDSWAICDTACFHLFDRTPFAWQKVHQWAPSKREFIRRGAFALLWALCVHDRSADDRRFLDGLELIEAQADDDRPLVRKGIDMALRATGKRNLRLHRAALTVADRLMESEHPSASWIGRHSAKELRKKALVGRLQSKS